MKEAITHVVESLHQGGLERVVLELAHQQQTDGHPVQIVCLFEGGKLAAEAAERGLEVRECGKRRGFDWNALSRTRRAVKALPTRVLHTHNAMAHYYAVAASANLAIRTVLNTRHGMGAGPPATGKEAFFRLASFRTDFQVAVCQAGRDELIRKRVFSTRKSRVVYNGIRLDRVRPCDDASRRHLRKLIDVRPDQVIVGAVGRLHWAKDHQNLLRAIGRVRRSLPGMHCLLVGDGELRRELEILAQTLGIENTVSFLGDRSDVPDLLAGLDVFVLPSKTEGYSVALLEAMAAGLPCVATDVGGNPEIIRHESNGLIVPPDDPDQLVSALSRLIESPHLRSELGTVARKQVLSRNTIRAMTDSYYQLYFGSREG